MLPESYEQRLEQAIRDYESWIRDSEEHDSVERFVIARGLEKSLADGLRDFVAATLQCDQMFSGVVDALADGAVPADQDTQQCDSTAVQLAVGQRIGPYRLVRFIDEGGLGTVWEAEQATPRRRVALKLIRSHSSAAEFIARFDIERNAIAMMQHPNIARVYDAGTTDAGRPYLVMELVHGVGIDTYCDTARLSVEDRLRLMVSVCRAVQHAHLKGIIHRDLKPGNILVEVIDGEPVAKVIDFGMAKTEAKLTDRSVVTSFGQLMGTWLYASPEQVRAMESSLDVDTRTDIYSLGVVLYQLLAGSTPIEDSPEIRQAILETDPPRPSERVSSIGGNIEEISELRQLTPIELRRRLGYELDWIVMKAIEKDRTYRYSTANEFADDIERHLNDETPRAPPPSATRYRVRKFVRKNRGLVAAVSAIVSLLLVGIVATTTLWLRSEVATQRAVASEALAEDQRRAEARTNYNLKLQLCDSVPRFRPYEAARILDQCDGSLREFTWYLLKQRFADRKPRSVVTTDAEICALSASIANPHRVAIGHRNGKIQVFDLNYFAEAQALRLAQGYADKIAWSCDSQFIAVISAHESSDGENSFVYLLSTSANSPVEGFNPARIESSLISVGFHDSGDLLAVDDAGSFHHWKRQEHFSHEVILNDTCQHVREAYISRTGHRIAMTHDAERTSSFKVTVTDDQADIRVELIDSVQHRRSDRPHYVPGTENLVVSGFGGFDELNYDMKTPTPQKVSLYQGQLGVRQFASDNGTMMATLVPSGVMLKWRGETHWIEHTAGCRMIALTCDGSRLLGVRPDNTLDVWPLTERVPECGAVGGGIDVVEVDDGIFAIVSGYWKDGKKRGSLTIVDASTRQVSGKQIVCDAFRPLLIAASPGRGTFATHSKIGDGETARGIIQIWNTASRQLQSVYPAPDDTLAIRYVSPTELAVVGAEQLTLIAYARGVVESTRIPQSTAGAITPDGEFVIVANAEDSCVELRAFPRGTLIRRLLDLESPANSITVSTVGDRFAVTCNDRYEDRGSQYYDRGPASLTLSAYRGQPNTVACIGSHLPFKSVAFSADGRTLVTAGEDGLIRLWDPIDGSLRLSFETNQKNPCRAVTFQGDGRVLVTVNALGQVNFWGAAFPE